MVESQGCQPVKTAPSPTNAPWTQSLFEPNLWIDRSVRGFYRWIWPPLQHLIQSRSNLLPAWTLALKVVFKSCHWAVVIAFVSQMHESVFVPFSIFPNVAPWSFRWILLKAGSAHCTLVDPRVLDRGTLPSTCSYWSFLKALTIRLFVSELLNFYHLVLSKPLQFFTVSSYSWNSRLICVVCLSCKTYPLWLKLQLHSNTQVVQYWHLLFLQLTSNLSQFGIVVLPDLTVLKM